MWREGLLARKVLQGHTRGYRNHPQLIRFRAHDRPNLVIDAFLWNIYEEAVSRSYNFDISKLGEKPSTGQLQVTEGQLRYELDHLLRKLKARDPESVWRFRYRS